MPIGRKPDCPVIYIGAQSRIPKELLVDVDEEKSRLTLVNKAKEAAKAKGFLSDAPEFYRLWDETDEYLYVPRAHRPKLKPELLRDRDYKVILAVPKQNRVMKLGVDQVSLGPNARQPFNQTPAFEALSSPNKWPYGRVLALRPGAGKTAIALKAAFARSMRTLWVTMNTSLLEQAKKNITEWLGISPKIIGHVQADKCDWRNRSIAVAMLHTLALRKYEPEFYTYWGLVIFDEGDVLGAEHFKAVITQFPAERWVLTATPKRADGMHTLYEFHVGPICYQHLGFDLEPVCYFVATGAPSKHLKRTGWDSRNNERRVNYQLTAGSLMLDDERTEFILAEHMAADLAMGRTILVLGDNVNGILNMAKAAREHRLTQHVTHGIVVGSVPQKEREAVIHGNRVVWATSQLAYRGLDRPDFDTIYSVSLVAVNEQRWTQAVGRILRFKEGKMPVVKIFRDENLEPMEFLYGKLAGIFKKKKWKVVGTEEIVEKTKRRNKVYRDVMKGGYGYR